jgi:imidazolonepropionase-like amidohydrolase
VNQGTRNSLLISGATIIDGVAERPIEGHAIWIEGARIRAIGREADLPRDQPQVIDGHGNFVIPGLMNANVHLFGVTSRLENLVRYEGRYDDIITESAQIALRSGLTTVFDTYGPRRFLMAARDKINSGASVGSRIFCAGNIIGFDGPLSPDFHARAAEVVSASFVRRINSIWVENAGRHLMWLPPGEVAAQVRAYIARGIDFVKYGSNEHSSAAAGAFLAFSHRQQAAIVEEAHRAGLTAQAHSMSVEGLRLAVEAGCNLVTHCNITGPVAIPRDTLELMARRETGAVIFPWTEKGLRWIKDKVSDLEWTLWQSTETNTRNLIHSGAPLLLANDGVVFDEELKSDPRYARSWVGAPEDVNLASLATGHFLWLKAMEEMGCPPMEMLRAATKNIAVAYGKDRDLGTLESGKIADMLVLEKNPLDSAENYSAISCIIKEGMVVDRDALPQRRLLSRPIAYPEEEEARYIEAIGTGPRLPPCPACLTH